VFALLTRGTIKKPRKVHGKSAKDPGIIVVGKKNKTFRENGRSAEKLLNLAKGKKKVYFCFIIIVL
jgi:hypothetical protein